MSTIARIRIGTKQDCAAVLSVLRSAFASAHNKLDPPSGVGAETVETLQKKCDEQTLLLAELDGRVVACLFFTQHRKKTDTLYFGRLGVLPAFQKQGIARLLICRVEQAAQQSGYAKVGLAVRIVLSENIQFFQSLGYEIIKAKAHPGYSEPTYYTMEKTIE